MFPVISAHPKDREQDHRANYDGSEKETSSLSFDKTSLYFYSQRSVFINDILVNDLLNFKSDLLGIAWDK